MCSREPVNKKDEQLLPISLLMLDQIKRSQHLSQHLFSHVERCRDHARSNGLNNLSTFQEQKKCCEDVETKFKWIQIRLNMSQHLIVERGCQTASTSALNKC